MCRKYFCFFSHYFHINVGCSCCRLLILLAALVLDDELADLLRDGLQQVRIFVVLRKPHLGKSRVTQVLPVEQLHQLLLLVAGRGLEEVCKLLGLASEAQFEELFGVRHFLARYTVSSCRRPGKAHLANRLLFFHWRGGPRCLHLHHWGGESLGEERASASDTTVTQ